MVRALREYETALRAGARPDRREWLARHADVADVLTECVDGLEMLRGMEPADPTPSPDYPSFDSTGEFVDPLLATPLGDFRLIREIGRGGMGVVYEAVQLSLGRRVALKVLPFAAALDGRHLQRFKNEAQAAAHLHHTNIVPVYAVGCERGVHFYAMQLIEGSSLAAILKDLRRAEPVARSAVLPSAGGDRIPSVSSQAAPSSRRQTGESAVNRASFSTLSAAMSTDRSGRRIDYYRSVATLGLQAAEALEYAHQMGVVHRDVKPGNLLLDTRGHLWIADFGLAQFSAATDLTAPGVAVGTLPYMSPEQQAGKGVVLDHRTDVYSLGATLYEMFSLRPAFEGTARHRLVNQIQFEDPAPLRSIDKWIPVELETIIMKAMS
ncbi:MAG TPA: serine/threonine-protein kinase, partial [Planctomycetia bacterium]|nr:serine/threonine-protein kinase [Planctomycetia bacterium]